MQKNDVYNNLATRGKTQDDIFIKIHKSVVATITLLANSKVGPGDLLVSSDGGKTFTSAYLEEYDPAKADYALDTKVVSDGEIYKALVPNPAVETISDDTKWKHEGKFVINGAAMITFERETKDNPESFSCAVAVDCELLSVAMNQFNESCRLAGFPNILMK